MNNVRGIKNVFLTKSGLEDAVYKIACQQKIVLRPQQAGAVVFGNGLDVEQAAKDASNQGFMVLVKSAHLELYIMTNK